MKIQKNLMIKFEEIKYLNDKYQTRLKIIQTI